MAGVDGNWYPPNLATAPAAPPAPPLPPVPPAGTLVTIGDISVTRFKEKRPEGSMQGPQDRL